LTFEEVCVTSKNNPTKLICEKCGNSIEAEPGVERDIDAANEYDFSNDSFESANNGIIIESVVDANNINVAELLKDLNKPDKAPLVLKKKEKICRVCNKSGFENQPELTRHENSHLTERLNPKEAFFCQICGQFFKSFDRLINHHRRQYEKQRFYGAASDE
jgi:hypothetical protein